MTEKVSLFNWTRPESVAHPKIWHTFKARDINSDNLVEYRIQDLPLDRIADCYEHLLATFIADEPAGLALGCEDDPHVSDDYKQLWEPILSQRMAIVCFKEGSTEIVGTNLVYISTQDDRFFHDIRSGLKGFVVPQMFEMMDILYENYDTFKAYSVDKYMSSLGLSVDQRYRGRGIGDHFLTSRKAMCREFDIHLTQTSFTSDFSNKNADKAGYKTDVVLSYAEIVEKHPRLAKLAVIKSKELSLKSLII